MTNIVTPQAPSTPSASAAASQMVVPARSRRKSFNRDQFIAILVLMPSFIAVLLFVYGFIFYNAWASLTNWSGMDIMPQIGPIRFPAGSLIGLRNYETLFGNTLFGGSRLGDQRFMTDLQNNAVFTVAFLIGCTVLGLLLAILLDQRIRGESLFRNFYLYPMALSFVVTGTVWRWVATGWIIDRNWALVSVIIAAVWQMTGFTMAMFLAALRSVPDDLREAARMDGATEVQIYRRVVLPLINPVILSALIILGHISLKIFDLVYVMTGGSSSLGFKTDMPSIYMYDMAFYQSRFGVASAIGMIILVLVAVIIIPYLWFNLRSETEI